MLTVSRACLKLSTEGWHRISGGSVFQVMMVLGRNEYFVSVHPCTDLPDVIGYRASCSGVAGLDVVMEWYLYQVVRDLVEHYHSVPCSAFL